MDLLARGVLGLLCDFFSLVTILMCLVAKVPQIRTLYGLKSAKGKSAREGEVTSNDIWSGCKLLFNPAGISTTGLYLETLSYTVMMAYNYCSRYAMLSYLEYPVLLLQNYALIYLVCTYKRMLQKETYLVAVSYFSLTLLVMQFAHPALLAPFVVSFIGLCFLFTNCNCAAALSLSSLFVRRSVRWPRLWFWWRFSAPETRPRSA